MEAKLGDSISYYTEYLNASVPITDYKKKRVFLLWLVCSVKSDVFAICNRALAVNICRVISCIPTLAISDGKVMLLWMHVILVG